MLLLAAFIIILCVFCTFLVDSARRRADAERIARLEVKVDQLLNHFDLAPAPISESTSRPPSYPVPVPIMGAGTDGLSATILDLVRRRQKIQAIKLYRELNNVGLKESKDAVEAIERRGF